MSSFLRPLPDYTTARGLVNSSPRSTVLRPSTARLIGLPFNNGNLPVRPLVAQAQIEGIPIISNDMKLDAYGITRLW